MKKIVFTLSAIALVLCAGLTRAHAALVLTVDSGATWLGYMNIFELPANGGTFLEGKAWGTADLTATFSGSTLRLGPNTIGDPNEYWYIGGGKPGAPGNKIMEANMYLENNAGALSGQSITFTANVLSNTLTSAHNAVAFIKDFAPDYSSFNVVTAPLVDGVFSITLETIDAPGRHVQYGFAMTGVNVWATDVGPFGNVQIAPIPEPSALGLLAGGMAGFFGSWRTRGRRPIQAVG